MPKEYIEREALLKSIQSAEDNGGLGSVVAGTLKRYVKHAPAADVVKVKHGYWKDNTNGTFTCSECGGRASKMDWCGCCGAKMDGKKVE